MSVDEANTSVVITHQANPWKNSPTRKIVSVGAKNGKKMKAVIAIKPGKIVHR